MMMPFVRLIAIYIVVGLAVFAFFKRDAIMALINGPEIETVNVGEVIATRNEAPVTSSPAAAPSQQTAEKPAPMFVTDEPTIQPPTPPITEIQEPSDTMEARVAAARDAFWSGDMDKAEAAYRALATDFPEDSTIAGELGNLYYNSGRHADAANQYYTVGLLALKAGNTTEAMTMIGVLQTLSPALAADLRNKAAQRN